MWKTQQKLRNERPSVFIKEINKIALTTNDDKTMQPIDSIEMYAFGKSEGSSM